MNRSLVFDLATCGFIAKREDALFLGPGGTGKSHLAQAIGQSAILQGHRVFYREAHVLLDELADAVAEGGRKQYLESLATVPLLIIDDFGMRKLPLTAAGDLLEIVMRRYERASTLLTSNRPVECPNLRIIEPLNYLSDFCVARALAIFVEAIDDYRHQRIWRVNFVGAVKQKHGSASD